MLFELRLAVDDRPGSLAALTALLAQQDIDIREIDFLGSAAGAAVDNVLIEASALQLETVREALADLDGFEILSTRPSGRLGGTQPELELLLGVARARGNGLEQFAAGCPRVLSADWAVTFTADSERPRLRTLIAPDVERQGRLPLRAAAVELTSGAYKVAGPPTTTIAHCPLGPSQVLVLGRTRGPAFHPLEVVRLQRLVEVGVAIAEANAGIAV